jgi:thimet oligopeptidase
MKFAGQSVVVVMIFLLTLFVLTAQVNTITEADQFKTQCEADFQQAKSLFEKLEKSAGPQTIETVLVPLNDLWLAMDRSGNLAAIYQQVHPDAQIRKIAEDYDQKFSRLETEIQLSRPIYDAVATLDLKKADSKTRRFAEITLRDFRRSGVDKDSAIREKIKKLKEELVIIGQEFDKNIREDVRSIKLNSPEELAGLPEDYIQNHSAGEDGKITITTDYPDYVPFITYAKSDARRFELYKQFRQRAYPKNEKVLHDLLHKRYELAQLLGYDNYAQYITEDKMIRNPQAAQEFIDRVTSVASPRAKKDYDELLKRLKMEIPGALEVGDWQKTYISELVKNESYNIDSREVRSYFPYERVKQGLLDLASRLFAVNFKKLDTLVWHPSVEVYEVWQDQKVIGRFYLDMHPRQDKFKHAQMAEKLSGVSGRQLPEAVLMCNFPGGDSTPGLMEHDEVSTFFHEFGHLLHHIFGGNQPWLKISGIATEWDFVETPSILLEEWVWDADILKTFAMNEAGKTIPDELVERMNKARKFGLGLYDVQQMYYAATSLNFYNRKYDSFDPLEMVKKLQQQYTPFAYVPDTYMHLAFGHLVDYSAIYYTYMWSEVIVKDLYGIFKEKGLLNQAVSVDYRQKILEPGGTQDAADLVRDFLGRDYSFDAFEDWLNKD